MITNIQPSARMANIPCIQKNVMRISSAKMKVGRCRSNLQEVSNNSVEAHSRCPAGKLFSASIVDCDDPTEGVECGNSVTLKCTEGEVFNVQRGSHAKQIFEIQKFLNSPSVWNFRDPKTFDFHYFLSLILEHFKYRSRPFVNVINHHRYYMLHA